LAAPNNTLNGLAPVAHLPQLQRVVFGSAVMGYGDLFIAGLLGALLAAQLGRQRRAVLIAAGLALALDLLFFVVNQLPATVPIALTLVVLEFAAWRSRGRAADAAKV
jgi:CHASE2 domain-containing sensor protein